MPAKKATAGAKLTTKDLDAMPAGVARALADRYGLKYERTEMATTGDQADATTTGDQADATTTGDQADATTTDD